MIVMRRLLAHRIPSLRSRALPTFRPPFCALSTTMELEPREVLEYDVVIVGAGPSGLSSAIRLKQLNPETNVCVVEKGAEVGAHILSGNIFEPRGLDELLPDWKTLGGPFKDPVTDDNFTLLTQSKSFNIPHRLLPPSLHNKGNYVTSLSQVTRWMATQAEELGVEIFPGFAASEVLYSNGRGEERVIGIATSDVGIGKDGNIRSTFQRGVELQSKFTLFGEGARGSLSEEVIKKFGLRENKHPPSYALGLKEVWQLSHDEERCRPGEVHHTLGWPLQYGLLDTTVGGGFMYHMAPNIIHVGFVVGLDYQNPRLDPYKEFQMWKHHPYISKDLVGGTCLSYGARVISKGGYHALPKMAFPGGALIGCAAGTLNVVKIKGTHTAIKCGALAAESTHEYLQSGSSSRSFVLDIDERVHNSWVGEELHQVRNCNSAFSKSVLAGVLHSGLSTFITKGKEPWTLVKKNESDSAATQPAANFPPIDYPKPDGSISFDLLTNLQRSGTYHDHDQPPHLVIKPNMKDVPLKMSLPVYDGPERHFCPAAVYEYPGADEEDRHEEDIKFVINAQNCLHCKCCSIKCPSEFIEWTVPEGGGGPAYTLM